MNHVCALPIYWIPYVAVGTLYRCPDCNREWFFNEDKKWQSEAMPISEEEEQ